MQVGFVDLQVNGWMGTSFTERGLTPESVKAVTLALAERGTAAYCPTVITGDPDAYRENFRAIVRAMGDAATGRRMLGIHLEGPFISPQPGAVGCHPRQWVKDPDVRTFEKFQEWAEGNIRLLTLAPERPGAEALIRHAAARGVVVSLGHHWADDAALDNAVRAGARLCTHVGNGIPNEIPRHRNPLWWTLACDRLSGMFITDGHHLPPPLIKVALRAKGVERFIVTSDAADLAGMPPGRYGRDIVIRDDGMICCESSKSLAGSHSVMIECMNHLAGLALLSEPDLWRVGRDNALAALGRTAVGLAGLGGPEVVFRDGRFEVRPAPAAKAT
jgi:N-acetylglucosamine-6-phosphate deacetylase